MFPALLICSNDVVWIQTESRKKDRSWHEPGVFSVSKKDCHYMWLCMGDRQTEWREVNKS